MNFGFFSKTQVSNLSKLVYDIGKLLVGGGIISPYLTQIANSATETPTLDFDPMIFVQAGICFICGLGLDAIYDRMNKN